MGENIGLEYKDAVNNVNKQYLDKWDLIPDGYYISVSTIEPRKNLGYLLEVLVPFLKEQQRKLVLVGRNGWGENKKLQQMIEEVGNYIVFTDYVTTKELFSLYHYAYAFVLLSKDEGFGRTPFEAVACGCKRIILSDIEIFRETFDGNALFLPLFDIEKAQSMISKVVNIFVDDSFSLPFDAIEKRLVELEW